MEDMLSKITFPKGKNITIPKFEPEIADRDKSNLSFMQSFRGFIYPEESLIKESIW